MAWGASGVVDAYDMNSGYMQYILSLGLAKLHGVIAAEGYDERHRILYTPNPVSDLAFLHRGINNVNNPINGDTLSENENNTTEDIKRLCPPFKHELDDGPIEAWRWAHQNSTSASSVYGAAQGWLRARGYVFWDLSRLNAWSVFQSPYEPPGTTVADAERASRAASERAWEDTRGRCNRRAEIYKVGGRGWWSLEDESKVVYPPGQSPPPYPNRGAGKTSQQAVDELQRKLAQGDECPEARPSWQTWKPRVPITREERRGRRTQP